MTGNALAALRALDNEDVVSNLLAYCVNSSRSFAAAFVSAVQGGQSDRYDEVRAYLRRRVPGVGVPDLLLKVKSGTHCDLVIIENKLTTEEGKDQTPQYARPLCVRSLRASLKDKHPLGEWRRGKHFAFLTLYPWQKPQSPQFRHVTYERLLSAIMPYERGQDVLADELFRDLSDAYSAFYASGHTEPGDLLMEKWSPRSDLDATFLQSGDLDSAFLHFGKVFEKMEYLSGLQVGLIAATSKLGRRFYLAEISKDTWRPRVARGMPGFNIHFEPQFDILRRRFSFYLHHQIGDFLPRKQAEEVYGRKLRGYDAARHQFTEYLAKAGVPGLLLGGRSNQVGKVQMKFDERTSLGEFPELVCSAIAKVTEAIDGFPLLR